MERLCFIGIYDDTMAPSRSSASRRSCSSSKYSQGDLESDSGDLRENLVLVDVSELVAVIGPITLTRRRFSGVKPEELYSRIHTELCLMQPGRRGYVLQ